MADILLQGGTVVDGSGRPAFRADVAITGDRITAVDAGPLVGQELASCPGLLTRGRTQGSALRLEVDGLVVAPGFVDCHSHSDLDLFADPMARAKAAQGVTTEIVGNCGFGPFPVRSEEAERQMSAMLPSSSPHSARPLFASLADYRAALVRHGMAVNVATLVPQGAVRMSVMGGEDRPARQGELDSMCELVRQAMEEGAAGLSFGLLYAPGCFTPNAELSALGRVAAECGRPLAFHVRNECDQFEESIAEAIQVGRETGAPVHISHLKVADPEHWGRIGRALARIEEARARGQTVTCDQYPYTAGSGPLQTLLPPWSLVGGTGQLLARLADPGARARMAAALSGAEPISGWSNIALRIGWDRIAVSSAPGAETWEGRRLAEIAAEAGRAPCEILFDALLASRGFATGIYHQMSEEDVRTVMPHPAQMVGSDGLPAPGRPHPRLWGTFPRVLGHYVRELGLLSLEDAVHRMSGKTAQTFALPDRGLVRAGCCADLCVFDPARIVDRATYEHPTVPPEGVVHVICNGMPTVLDGARTDRRPGVFLGPAG